ncbi:hypothetical protein [Nostoc sp. CALU 546]|uniref:hypothetical protein n=1 Tax=Nostoc sp. CALU 546 TaxID=1867241 RepID=UPI003B684552
MIVHLWLSRAITYFLCFKSDGMRGLALQSLKHRDKYNCNNQSLWLGIDYCDRSYGTAIASLLDKLTITSIVKAAAAYFLCNCCRGDEGKSSAAPFPNAEKGSHEAIVALTKL